MEDRVSAEAEAPPAPLRVNEDFEEEFPGSSRSATTCAINLVRTSSLYLTEIDRARRVSGNLSATASQILAVIEGAEEPLPPHVIGERLLVTSGTMTSLLDTLERRGLIVRVAHPTDRRKLLIDITDEARRILDVMMPRIHAVSRDVFEPLSEEERANFVEYLARVQERLYAMREQPPRVGDERRVKRNST